MIGVVCALAVAASLPAFAQDAGGMDLDIIKDVPGGWSDPDADPNAPPQTETNPLDRDFKSALDAYYCLLYTSPSPRDRTRSRMPSSA